MFLLIFNIIQSQQQPSLSPFVIALAVLTFIIGVSLLVYFFRRIKTSEKEPEEDWTLSRRSLFVTPDPVEQKKEEVSSEVRADAGSAGQEGTRELASVRTGEIHEITGEKVSQEPQATTPLRAERPPAPETGVKDAPSRQPEPEPLPRPRPTEVLASPQPDHVIKEAEAVDEAAPFDDDVWAGLEINQQQSPHASPPAGVDQGTQLLGSAELRPATERPSTQQAPEQQAQWPVESSEPQLDARVERRAGREPFEPPIIKPLTPREESTFIERQRVSHATDDLYASSTHESRGAVDYGPNVERRPPQNQQRSSADSLYEDAARRIESTATSNIRPTPADRPVEPSVTVRQVGRRSTAGSVLGLPAEPSHDPLILGDPVRSKEELSIGALSNYGRPAEKDGGWGGTIALLVVVLIIGGGLLAYFLIPSVHLRANAWVEHLRGIDVEKARIAAMTPKAVIYPRLNSEVNKNQVKVKGAIENIWNEPLENLTVEVSLQRGGDAPPQVIKAAVNPNPLPPNQRGSFDFEYDGKRDTGFVGYKITKLLSGDNEVKFTSPNAQK